MTESSGASPTMIESALRMLYFVLLGLSTSILVVGVRLQSLVFEDHAAVPSLYTVSLCLAIGHGASLLWTCIADIRYLWGENDPHVEMMGGRVVMGVLLLASIPVGLYLNFGGDTNIPFFVGEGLPQIILTMLSGEIASLSAVLYFPFARESVNAISSLTIGSSIGNACIVLLFTALIHHPYHSPWNTYFGAAVELFQLLSLVGWAYLLKEQPSLAPPPRQRDCDETVDCGTDELDEQWYREANSSETTSSESGNFSADEETPSLPDPGGDDATGSSGAIRRITVPFNVTRIRSPTLDATLDRRTKSLHATQFWLQAMAASSVVLFQHLHSFDANDGGFDRFQPYMFSLYFGTCSEGFGAVFCSVAMVLFNRKAYYRFPSLLLTGVWGYILALVVLRSSGSWITSRATWSTLSAAGSISFRMIYGYAITACYQAVASKSPVGPAGDHMMRVNATWNQLGAMMGSLVAVMVILR